MALLTTDDAALRAFYWKVIELSLAGESRGGDGRVTLPINGPRRQAIWSFSSPTKNGLRIVQRSRAGWNEDYWKQHWASVLANANVASINSGLRFYLHIKSDIERFQQIVNLLERPIEPIDLIPKVEALKTKWLKQ
jgi:hypothetical protein